jgi:hypothetical protein
MDQPDMPVVRFYRLIDEARFPQRADRSAAGTLPTRAYRYCQPATSAAGFGWWVFPPADLQFLWDGHDIFWQRTGGADWLPLAPSAQFPDFAARFDATAPKSVAGCSPPFLTALPESGTLQIWTGLIARTAMDWSLLIRAPANLPSPGGYWMYEGIVEADRWFGPLFTNLRFTRTHSPIRLKADFPLAQVQPLPRQAYAETTLGAGANISDMGGLSASDWDAYRDTIAVPNDNPDRAFGAYAATARKRGKATCRFAAASG